ncbi:MAG: alpha/beta fold hydrolase [Dehalococcoidia bacterium]
MERATIDGVTLEYEIRGAGEPVVLLHGSHVAETFAPLLEKPDLAERFRLIRYHRRGFAGSTHSEGPVSIAQQAADCRALLRALGIERAHVAGHSYGGAIALQLALDAPEMVHSLALLEPAVTAVPSAEQFMAGMTLVGQMYAAGDKAGAVDAFLQAVCGPEYRAVLDRALPGAMEQAAADGTPSSGSRCRRCWSGDLPRRSPKTRDRMTAGTMQHRAPHPSGRRSRPCRRLPPTNRRRPPARSRWETSSSTRRHSRREQTRSG